MGDFRSNQSKLCRVKNPLFQEIEFYEETSTRAVVHFGSSRGIEQRLRFEDGQDRSQVFMQLVCT